jgi:aspartate racemase
MSERIAGIVGGLGPESTIDYYRTLVSTWRERAPGRGYPRVVIDSLDFDVGVELVSTGRLDELTEYLAGSTRRLAAAGASFAVMAANTAHIVYGAVRDASPIPLVSIVDVACEAAGQRGLRRLALIGTRFTMQARFYPEVFGPAGIQLVTPDDAEQQEIHRIYLGELVKGVFLDESRARLLAVLERLVVDEHVDGVILAGTELPLILRGETLHGLPVLDTTKLHIAAMIDQLVSPMAIPPRVS